MNVTFSVEVFADRIKDLQMTSSEIDEPLNPVTSVLTRERRETHTRRHYRWRRPCEDETEIGIRWPQAKELQELPEAGRCTEGSSFQAYGGSIALPTP